MTYQISVSGSMQNLDDETVIESAAREMLDKLEGVMSATVTTTHGGSVNLLAPAAVEEVNSGDPGDEQPE